MIWHTGLGFCKYWKQTAWSTPSQTAEPVLSSGHSGSCGADGQFQGQYTGFTTNTSNINITNIDNKGVKGEVCETAVPSGKGKCKIQKGPKLINHRITFLLKHLNMSK